MHLINRMKYPPYVTGTNDVSLGTQTKEDFSSSLKISGATSNGRKRSYSCDLCGYVTDRKNNLKRHVSTMHDACEQILECCGIVFPTKAVFKSHTFGCHVDGYSCKICGRKFGRKALLKRHLSIHTGQKSFRCPECGYSTSHKSNLERHSKVHRKGEPKTPTSTTDAQLCDSHGNTSDRLLPLKKRRLLLATCADPVRMQDSQSKIAIETTPVNWQPIVHATPEDHSPTSLLPVPVQSQQGGWMGGAAVVAVSSGDSFANSNDGNGLLPAFPKWPLPSAHPFYSATYYDIRVDVPTPATRTTGDNGRDSVCCSSRSPSSEWSEERTDEEQQQQRGDDLRESPDAKGSKPRLHALPYKCFNCNSLFPNQLQLHLHCQFRHPAVDVATMSIVNVMRKMRQIDKGLFYSREVEHIFDRHELQTFLSKA